MFGMNWLKNFAGALAQPQTAAAPTAAAEQTSGSFKFAPPVDTEAALRPQGWRGALAMGLSAIGDVGRGMDGRDPYYVPAIQARWLKNAQNNRDKQRAASAEELINKALNEMDPADRPVMEAQLRAAPDVDTALQHIGTYQEEVRKRRMGREDFTWEQDQKVREGQPVEGMDGYQWGPMGADGKRTIVEVGGFGNSVYGRDAQGRINLTSAQTAAAYANANESNANADYIRDGKGKGAGPDLSKMPEAMLNAAAFADRMKRAVSDFDNANTIPGGYDRFVQGFDETPIIGGAIRATRTAGAQLAENSEKSFISGLLRKESGAVISPSEYATYGPMFFPRPGDKPEAIRQKRVLREDAIKALQVMSRGAYEAMYGDQDYSPRSAPPPAARGGTGNRTIDRLSGGAVQDSDIAAELKRRGLN